MSFDPNPQADITTQTMPKPDSSPFGTPQPPKSNRKWWFLGCGGCLFFVLLVCGGGGAFFYFQFGKPFNELLAESQVMASEAQAVKDKLGTPVEIGSLQQSSTSNNNGNVVLEYSFPISGPNGEGTLYLEAGFDNESWTWTRNALYIEVDGEKITVGEDEFDINIDMGDGDTDIE